MGSMLALQERVSQQNQIVLNALKMISHMQARFQKTLLSPKTQSLWKPVWNGPADRSFDSMVGLSFSRSYGRTLEFLRARRYAGLVLLALFLVLLATHFVFRRRILRWIAAHPDAATQAHSFNRPISLAL